MQSRPERFRSKDSETRPRMGALSSLHVKAETLEGEAKGGEGGGSSYRCTKNLVTGQCVTGRLCVPPPLPPKVAFLVLHFTSISSQGLGSPLPGTKNKNKKQKPSPTPSSPTRAGRPASLGPTGSQNLLRIRQISRIGRPPELDPNSQTPGVKGKLPCVYKHSGG